MADAIEHLVDTMDDVRKGRIPNKAADIVRGLGVGAAMNKTADRKMIEVIGNGNHRAMLERAQEKIKDMTA